MIALFGVLVVTGCGGGSVQGTSDGGGGAGGGGGSTGTGGNGNTGPLLTGGATIGTYIVLGDAISAHGGTGPYFDDQLNADLAGKFPGLTFVQAAQKDAIVDVYGDLLPKDVPLMKTQVAGLRHDYPGDVLISITIGGGDLNGHAIAAITGSDAGFRAEFDKHLGEQLAELTTPGRLGTGKVYVVLGTIYDFTDGMGNFATVQCGPAANVNPSVVQATFGSWNGVIASNANKIGAALYDMHADFNGHGYNNSNVADVWYDAGDFTTCLLPNMKGHDSIRRALYKIVTGDTLP
ncbi:MAG: hypothetical protein JWN44_5153 [Myxococcales bacterium]|nr:hypothetical protein [Myxococcales bacterium]